VLYKEFIQQLASRKFLNNHCESSRLHKKCAIFVKLQITRCYADKTSCFFNPKRRDDQASEFGNAKCKSLNGNFTAQPWLILEDDLDGLIIATITLYLMHLHNKQSFSWKPILPVFVN